MKTINPTARILNIEISKTFLIYNILSKDTDFDNYNFYNIYFELYNFKKFLRDI